MPIVPGTKFGPYEIQSLLGAGGMGEVYRARDTVLKRDVAIKVLPAQWSSDPDRLRRFELEAQAAAVLNHPNIVSIYHVGEHEGAPYIVTELLHGESLRDRLHRGAMRVGDVLDAGADMSRALATAHHAGVIHRDLKPENIFLTKEGRVKILDFGLAKLTPALANYEGKTVTVSEKTEPGHVMGTVGYMAPEQVRGQPADSRSDIFSVGVILYEMLTGGRAFRKPTSAETMTAILNEEPAPISQIVPSVAPGLQRTVARCLAKDPEKRFQHASDLAFALEAFSDSTTSPAIATQQPFRLRWPWVTAALAILGIVAVLAVWWNLAPAVPVVESITQLTDDGEQKLTGQLGALLATDGARVYFEEGPTGSMRLAQVSVSGGRTGFIDSPRGELLQGISSDGSALLVLLAFLDNNVTLPLWSIPIPAGEPRRLGDGDATCATYFPDGRLLVIKGAALYIADKDGSNPRLLATLDQRAWLPSISPDGKRIVVTVFASGKMGLIEITVDGSRPPRLLGQNMFRGTWSYDGKYLIYGTSSLQGSDLWALPMHTGWFHRATKPIRLTNGALWFMGSLSSRDGKQLFTIGNKPHSELVHFDMKSRQFVPFFGGLSAISPTFSSDGKWVEYTSYPDHSLWRSRSDGTDRMQLTFPPVEVAYPNISPDGSKVAFGNLTGQLFIVSMQGGAPEMVVDSHATAGLWSPDSRLLVLTSFRSGPNGKNHYFLRILDTRTRQLTEVPGSEGMVGGMWVTEETIVAANQDGTEFNLFDSRTGKWNHLLSGRFVNWSVSRDGQYLVFTTGGADPQAQRLRIADRHLETLTSLTNLRRVVDPIEGQTQLTLAPDGSAVFARDIGTQEIYALNMKWP